LGRALENKLNSPLWQVSLGFLFVTSLNLHVHVVTVFLIKALPSEK
jgi:hypothetical protein